MKNFLVQNLVPSTFDLILSSSLAKFSDIIEDVDCGSYVEAFLRKRSG